MVADGGLYQVAFFTNTYKPFVGGVPNSVDLFQRYLRQLGDRVVVYAPHYDNTSDDNGDEEVRRLPSIRHFNNTDFSFPLPISFKPISDFSGTMFDVVHVHHPFLLGEMGLHIARQHRLPLVFTYHTQYEKYTHYVPVQDDLAARTIIRHSKEFCNLCDLVIAPTRDIACTLRQRGVRTQIEILPTGIELKNLTGAERGAVRRELGLSDETPVLVHVGRLAKEKNLVFLLDACLRALERVPEAHFVIAGEGKIMDALKEQTARAGEPGQRVRFLGTRTGPDLANVYATGDLFVFSSQSETQGLVIAEAMGTGLPTVALDADGVRELVRDGVNGRLLADSTDEEGFAAAIAEALRDREALGRWREAAAATGREMDMAKLAARLHDLYRELKLLPNRLLKQETISFGLIRNYFETVWEDLEKWFLQV